MNRYTLVKAGIDVNQGLRRFNQNKEMYEMLLLQFLSDGNFSGLSAALARADAPGAFQCAHALKGIAGNLSLEKLHEALLPLVEELRAGRLDQAPTLFPPVQESYARLVEVLKQDETAHA